MSKAEERALECIPTHPNEGLEKQRKRFREFYVDGYEQAVKDIKVVVEQELMFAEELLKVSSNNRFASHAAIFDGGVVDGLQTIKEKLTNDFHSKEKNK